MTRTPKTPTPRAATETKRQARPRRGARPERAAAAEAPADTPVPATATATADAVPQIGLDELMRRLADPAEDEAALIPYLATERRPAFGLEPVLLPNQNVRMDDRGAAQARARGDIGLGFLNQVYRARRRRSFEDRLADHDPRPVLLAEGDSWFQYPVFLDDVVDHLAPDYTVLCLSAAGDELRSMVAQAEYRDFLRDLAARGVTFRAMLFSAGGNDVVGEHMVPLLRDHRPGLDAAGHIEAGAWARKIGDVVAGYEQMIAAVQGVLPGLPILIHGYDHANPLPKQGFSIPPLDGWVGEPMRRRGIPDGPLQQAIVRLMIDGVNEALRALAGGNAPGGRHPRVFFVDNRGVVQGRWHDELHPTDAGFRDVARNFRRMMQGAGVP